MSHQSSTSDNIKQTANSVYESAANAIASSNQMEDYNPKKDKANFKKDVHGNTVKQGDFKDQLNDAATGGTKEPEPTYVGKVMSNIPGVDKLQQIAYDKGEPTQETHPPGPPERPDHDVQVEQFLRKQYHSKNGDGMPDLDSKD